MNVDMLVGKASIFDYCAYPSKAYPLKAEEGMLSSYDSNNLDGINFYMNEIVAHEKNNPSANYKKASEQQLCFDFT